MLAEEKTGDKEKWAIKFLERGNKITKVRGARKFARGRGRTQVTAHPPCPPLPLPCVRGDVQRTRRGGGGLCVGKSVGLPPTKRPPLSPPPLSPAPLPHQYVGRELVNHSRLLHPHIVQFREVFLTDKVREKSERE